MIIIKYFAKTREQIGLDEEHFELPPRHLTAGDLVQLLRARGAPYHDALDPEHLLCAINHEMMSLAASLEDEDEVAFFPPVTGG